MGHRRSQRTWTNSSSRRHRAKRGGPRRGPSGPCLDRSGCRRGASVAMMDRICQSRAGVRRRSRFRQSLSFYREIQRDLNEI